MENITKEELNDLLGRKELSEEELEKVSGGISDWALKCIRDADELYRSGAIDHAEWSSRLMSCRSNG